MERSSVAACAFFFYVQAVATISVDGKIKYKGDELKLSMGGYDDFAD